MSDDRSVQTPPRGPQNSPPRSPQPGWLGGTSASDPTEAQPSLEQSILSLRRLETERFQQEVRALGGPEEWLRAKSPNVLRRLPGALTEEILFSETAETWIGASERIGQCANCPQYGGTCANHGSAIPDGQVVQIGTSGIARQPCRRWKIWEERSSLSVTGLPDLLLEWSIERVIGTERDAQYWPQREDLHHWIEEARKPDFKRWLVVTGERSVVRTRLLASIAREIVRDVPKIVHYTWCPKLATGLKEFFARKDRDSDETQASPIERCESAWCFFLDFVDPRPGGGRAAWSDWFLARVDEMLFHRLSVGLPTIIGTPLSIQKLADCFPMTGPFLEPVVIDIGHTSFGPLVRE